MPEKIKRRIGFMTQKQREQEEARMRTHTHVQKCSDYADSIYQILLIQTPEQTDKIIKAIDILLYWKKDNDNST